MINSVGHTKSWYVLLDPFYLSKIGGAQVKEQPWLWLVATAEIFEDLHATDLAIKIFITEIRLIISVQSLTNYSPQGLCKFRSRTAAGSRQVCCNGVLYLESSVLFSQIDVPLTRIRSWTSGEWSFLRNSQVANEVWKSVICNTVFLIRRTGCGLPLRKHQSALC